MPSTSEAPRAIADPDTSLRGSGSLWLATATVLLLTVCCFLRIWRLGNLPGINGDEAWSGVQAMRLLHGQPIAWRTPTGNPVNVFFLLPLAALHTVFSPSFVVLRSVAVVSGILSLVVNYWLCWRAFDCRTALVSTVLLAALPINIAYSRLGWDASQSLLATVVVLYLPLIWLRHRSSAGPLPLGAMVALAAALIVHPTNIFATPLLVVPIIYARRNQLIWRLRTAALPARPGSLAGLVTISAIVVYIAWVLLATLVTRLHGPSEFGEFCQNYLRLLSGATVYEYISGVEVAKEALAPFVWLPLASNWILGFAMVIGAWGLVQRLLHGADAVDVSLLLGWSIMLLGFALVAGPGAIVPHLERYGICLVAPGALVLSRGLEWWIEPARPWARASAWGLLLVGGLFPLMFYLGYFEFIERSGGLSHRAFRTAKVEPKLAALGKILAERGPEDAIRIVASEWWLYWPLAYLAQGEHSVDVREPASAIDPLAPEPVSRSRTTWYVEFVGSPTERELRRNGHDGVLERRVLFDYAGRPLISVFETRQKKFPE